MRAMYTPRTPRRRSLVRAAAVAHIAARAGQHKLLRWAVHKAERTAAGSTYGLLRLQVRRGWGDGGVAALCL